MNETEEKKARNAAALEFQKPPPREDETELLEIYRTLQPKEQFWALKFLRGFLP